MALLMLRSSGFHGFPYAKELSIFMGLCPKAKNEWNKWKNHFLEMKGDVGM